MKKVFKVCIIICFLGFVGGMVALFTTSNASNADKYEIGKDTIPSIQSVVGRRQITSVSTENSKGILIKNYTYKNVENPEEDLTKYITYIREHDGFLITEPLKETATISSLELGKKSIENGKIVLMDIGFSNDQYTISLKEGEGTLTEQ